MNKQQFIEEIQNNTEWLSTIEGDEIECIGIENLEGILKLYLNEEFDISQGKIDLDDYDLVGGDGVEYELWRHKLDTLTLIKIPIQIVRDLTHIETIEE